MKSTRSCIALAAVCGMLTGTSVLAQGFPAKPIDLIVHTGPGGGSDVFTRVVADIIAKDKLLPVSTMVLNKAGGGGAIAQNYVAGRRGDPYTVYAIAAALMVAIPIRNGTDTGLDKFQPLGLLGFDLNALTVRPDSPYRTVRDLVEAARANPKGITISVGSVGSSSHNVPFTLEKLAGVRFNVVHMKSGAEAVTTMLGGHVHATAEQLAEMTQYIEAGKVRILGVAAQKRIGSLPNVPTIKEQGYDLHVGAGRGFMSPAGIPKDAAAALETAFANVYKSAAWRDYMRRNYYEEVYMNGAELTRHMNEIRPAVEQYIKDLGLANKP